MLFVLGIRSLIGFSKPGKAPSPFMCSTAEAIRMTLALKLFRGERAITEFD